MSGTQFGCTGCNVPHGHTHTCVGKMLEDGHSQKSKISQSTTSAAESGDCVTVHKQHGLECMQTNEEMEAQCITGGRPAAQAKICF